MKIPLPLTPATEAKLRELGRAVEFLKQSSPGISTPWEAGDSNAEQAPYIHPQ